MFSFKVCNVHPECEGSITFTSLVESVKAYDTSFTVDSVIEKLINSRDLERVFHDEGVDNSYDTFEDWIECMQKYDCVLEPELIDILTVIFDGWKDLAIEFYQLYNPLYNIDR